MKEKYTLPFDGKSRKLKGNLEELGAETWVILM
jgi:hypothetical protein